MTADIYECRVPMTPRMEEAIAEMKARITSRFPSTTFEQYQGEDPIGIYLIAIVDTDDLREVKDLYLSRIVDLQVDEGLPLFVVPERTPERNRAIIAEQDAARHLRSAS
ncbi:MAG: hypothetical protein U0031_16535 [Thermomicrobiales bacterium]